MRKTPMRLNAVKNTDRIVVPEEGRAAEQGTHDELLARNGIYVHIMKGTAKSRKFTAAGIPVKTEPA